MTRIISIVGGLQPSTPTIGTATDGGTGTSANVAFTASSYIGKGTITYTATSSPGGFTGTGSSSPISVTGLTTGTAYTFTVVGTTNYGVSSLTSGSSNSVTPVNPDSGSMFPLGAVTVGATPLSTITFSSIPSTYTHLQLRMFGKTSSTDNGSGIYLQLNSSGLTSTHRLTGERSGTAGSQYGANSIICYFPCIATGVGNMFGAAVLDILDYANTNKNKTTRTLWGYNNNGVAGGSEFLGIHSGLWNNTAAVNSITLTVESSRTFSQYSSFALYGIKGA